MQFAATTWSVVEQALRLLPSRLPMEHPPGPPPQLLWYMAEQVNRDRMHIFKFTWDRARPVCWPRPTRTGVSSTKKKGMGTGMLSHRAWILPQFIDFRPQSTWLAQRPNTCGEIILREADMHASWRTISLNSRGCSWTPVPLEMASR